MINSVLSRKMPIFTCELFVYAQIMALKWFFDYGSKVDNM